MSEKNEQNKKLSMNGKNANNIHNASEQDSQRCALRRCCTVAIFFLSCHSAFSFSLRLFISPLTLCVAFLFSMPLFDDSSHAAKQMMSFWLNSFLFFMPKIHFSCSRVDYISLFSPLLSAFSVESVHFFPSKHRQLIVDTGQFT